MFLETLNVQHLGPFLKHLSLRLDPRVTILTGSNDTGKSSLLNALRLAFVSTQLSQDEVNHDHLQEIGAAWTSDTSIFVSSTVKLNRSTDLQPAAKIGPDDSVDLHHPLAPAVQAFQPKIRLQEHSGAAHKLVLPRVIIPKLSGGLRDEVNLRELMPLEKALLSVAFDEEFNFPKYENLSELHFTRAFRTANARLDKLFEKVLPTPGLLKLDLYPIAGAKHRIALMLRDRHDAITPFGLRGSGVQRMITLLAELVTAERDANHRLILLDEPENSLHADAQHLLREFLWDISSDGRTQVVYTTHSPCMINPLRPEQIRVLIREKMGETATSALLKRPASDNFAGVRTSLGLSAADSLLYAPVTVITEGETEVRNILPMFQKLAGLNDKRFADCEKLLALCTFLDGMGDSFELLCRVAKAHGTHVVLFLDGDKRNLVQTQGVESKNPGVPIIFTPGISEFEELVPPHIYIQAAMELVNLEFTEETMNSFLEWSDSSERRKRRAFSKRVEEWFRDTFDEPFLAKPTIMRKAIEAADVSEIDTVTFANLLQSIRGVLQGSSFV